MRYQSSRPAGLLQRLGFFRLLLILSFGALLTACPDKKPKFPNCGSDKDCKEGQHCFQKHCSECSEDSHCESFQTCSGGSCILKDGMCESSDDCTAGKICKKNECTACEKDAQCGTGSRCSDGSCLERGSCSVDEDCEDDEDCIDGQCKREGREPAPELSCQLHRVLFGFNEYSISDDAKTSLQLTSECIQQGGDRKIFVTGHTDDIGTVEYNIALSEKRGRSVADFLARLGIDPVRLRVVPRGEEEATASDDGSRAEERRVDFEW